MNYVIFRFKSCGSFGHGDNFVARNQVQNYKEIISHHCDKDLDLVKASAPPKDLSKFERLNECLLPSKRRLRKSMQRKRRERIKCKQVPNLDNRD